MKLFLIATLIAVSYAARLEHLEQQQNQLRAYLPPHQGGAGANGFGAASAGQPNYNARGAFPSTSNQYLPPDHGPSAFASSGSPDFAGSINGFGPQNVPTQQFGQTGPQYGQAPNQFGQDATPQGSSPFGSQAYQPVGANRQYIAPNVHSSQDIPQQPFDEQTGYHY